MSVNYINIVASSKAKQNTTSNDLSEKVIIIVMLKESIITFSAI